MVGTKNIGDILGEHVGTLLMVIGQERIGTDLVGCTYNCILIPQGMWKGISPITGHFVQLLGFVQDYLYPFLITVNICFLHSVSPPVPPSNYLVTPGVSHLYISCVFFHFYLHSFNFV